MSKVVIVYGKLIRCRRLPSTMRFPRIQTMMKVDSVLAKYCPGESTRLLPLTDQTGFIVGPGDKAGAWLVRG